MTGDAPYPGLRPYGTGDQDRFYGRSHEARTVSALWQSNRLLILHGASGVGKTSLLQAGVVTRFNSTIADILPIGRVSFSSPFLATPPLGHNPYIMALFSSWSPADLPMDLVDLSIVDFLRRRRVLTDRDGNLLPILAAIDQFEEIVDDHPHRLHHFAGLMNQLADAIAAIPNLRLLISIRQNALADLLTFGARLASGSVARFQLLPLGPEAALEAVTQSLVGTGRTFAPGSAKMVVDQLRSSKITNSAGATIGVMADFVSPVELQVACGWSWRSLPPMVSTITEDYLPPGGVDRALEEYCARMVAAVANEHQKSVRELSEWLERTFVTELGTRALAYEGFSETQGMPNVVARALENRYILRSEWRSGARWYELPDDRIIRPIRQAARLQAEEHVIQMNPDDYLRTAETALADGELELAQKHGEEAMRLCGDDDLRPLAEAELLLADLAFRGDEFDRAEGYYRQAAEHFELLHDQVAVGQVLAAIGRVLLARGKHADAAETLQTAVERLQSDLGTKIELARALWSSGQLQAAAAVFSTVLTIGPDEAEALAGRGQIRMELDDPVAALEDLDNLLQLRPDIGRRSDVRAARAVALAQLDRLREALTEADAALADAPDAGPVLLRVSGVARAAGESTRAFDLLRRAHHARHPSLLPHQLAEVDRLLSKSTG